MRRNRIHHTAIVTGDLEAGLRFWGKGIGMQQFLDHTFEGDWPTLLGAPGTQVRSVMLGDPETPEAGVVELVEYPAEVAAEAPPPGGWNRGFLLVSLFVPDLDEVLGRLAALGYDDVKRIEVDGPTGPVPMASLCDPDGVLVELIGTTGM
ncbi:MAG TPA: VOC family protein [Acidimicrobiia bacterium]|nr:VOC family protein [Acidimicrobiia bacterium]